jgi:transposase
MLLQMARPTPPIILSRAQSALLHTLVGSREVPHGLAERAGIVLAASEGRTNKAIAKERGLCEETVGLWRRRWLEGGAELEKLEHHPKQLRKLVGTLLANRPRPGCPGLFTAEQICRLLALACESPPEHLDHWTRPELARALMERGVVESISASSVGRFLKPGGPETPPPPVLAEPGNGGRTGIRGRGQDDLQALPPSPGVA